MNIHMSKSDGFNMTGQFWVSTDCLIARHPRWLSSPRGERMVEKSNHPYHPHLHQVSHVAAVHWHKTLYVL